MKAKGWNLLGPVLLTLFILSWSFELFGNNHSCCPEDRELSYLLSPKAGQRFQYLVRYETFFSNVLGKEKGYFVILPDDFHREPEARYPVLFLLHGYNFHRNGLWWKVVSPEKAKKVLCEVKEEEYHWLLHEDIAVVYYAMTDSKNRTYRDLEDSLAERFEELSKYGGLAKGDYTPREIAQSIVSHNLHSNGSLSDFFHPLQKMVLVLPDGDNGFYTDEDEGKVLFPKTDDRGGCDQFKPGEALNYSLFPFLYMKPGALGRHESHFLELVRYLESRSPYGERVLPKRGLGGISIGGFGALKLGLKYPHLFHSISSQSGLLDIELIKDKWMLKMILPEFLEVFGRLETKKFPPSSSLNLKQIGANNPLRLVKDKKAEGLRHRIYFDYGEKEGFYGITDGNLNFERAMAEGSHRIVVQPFNGKAGHNYQFWRSRSGNMLKHHSDQLK